MYKIFNPFLHKRSDGSLPATNTFIGDLENHFSNNHLSFHFGTDENGNVCDLAIRLFLTDGPVCDGLEDDLYNSVLNFYDRDKLIKHISVLEKYNLHLELLVINDGVNWRTEENNLFVVDFSISDDGEIMEQHFVASQRDYQRFLVDVHGIHRTNKPLIYATSEFEGFLSDVSTPSCTRDDITLFPGDADLIEFDDENNVIGLYEFKKHTMSGYGNIEFQSFRKYYYKDQKKYESLVSLCRRFNLDCFYNIIYSTRTNELNKIKVETINSNFTLVKDDLFEFSSINELKEILHNLR